MGVCGIPCRDKGARIRDARLPATTPVRCLSLPGSGVFESLLKERRICTQVLDGLDLHPSRNGFAESNVSSPRLTDAQMMRKQMFAECPIISRKLSYTVPGLDLTFSAIGFHERNV